jgi:hypothetical protein
VVLSTATCKNLWTYASKCLPTLSWLKGQTEFYLHLRSDIDMKNIERRDFHIDKLNRSSNCKEEFDLFHSVPMEIRESTGTDLSNQSNHGEVVLVALR